MDAHPNHRFADYWCGGADAAVKARRCRLLLSNLDNAVAGGAQSPTDPGVGNADGETVFCDADLTTLTS